jgi:hypothetical protein
MPRIAGHGLHYKEDAHNCYEGIKGAGSFSSVQ